MDQNQKDFIGLLAFSGFEEDLTTELKRRKLKILDRKERLFLVEHTRDKPIWAQSYWTNPEWISVTSINEAARELKNRSSLWANYHFHLHRRSELIQEKVLRKNPPAISFPSPLPNKNFSAWTLWEQNLLLASTQTNSPFPLGTVDFKETKIPPSRAYLKLWEVFTLYPQTVPTQGSRVLDLGSSPGGWSWVLGQLGSTVISIDKAPLAPVVAKLNNVQWIKKDAFQLNPNEIGKVDVLFSDIICEPAKLYTLVQTWMQSGLCKKFVCTIKFKGKTDFSMMDDFLKIPQSQIIHLYNNKHEVTWLSGFPQ